MRKKQYLLDLTLAVYIIAETLVLLGWGLIRALWMPVAWIGRGALAAGRRWPAQVFGTILLVSGSVLVYMAFVIGPDQPVESATLFWGGLALLVLVLWRLVCWLINTSPHPLEND